MCVPKPVRDIDLVCRTCIRLPMDPVFVVVVVVCGCLAARLASTRNISYWLHFLRGVNLFHIAIGCHLIVCSTASTDSIIRSVFTWLSSSWCCLIQQTLRSNRVTQYISSATIVSLFCNFCLSVARDRLDNYDNFFVSCSCWIELSRDPRWC